MAPQKYKRKEKVPPTKKPRKTWRQTQQEAIVEQPIKLRDVGGKSIVPGKCLVDNDLQGTCVIELIQFQGWDYFLHLNCSQHTKLVEEFYSYLRADNSTLETHVQGHRIRIDEATISTIFQLPRDGFGSYLEKGWPGISEEEQKDCTQFLKEHSTTNRLYPSKNELFWELRIVLNLIMEAIVPRHAHDNRIAMYNGYILYLLYKKRKINLPSIILSHMLYVATSKKSLAYGTSLTKIFEHFEVPLSPKPKKFDSSWYLDMRSLNRMGFYWYRGQCISSSEFKKLSAQAQEQISKRAKNGTTFDIEEEMDEKVPVHEDLVRDARTEQFNPTGVSDEDQLMQLDMVDSRHQNDENQERRKGASSSSTGQQSFSTEATLRQILIQMQAMNTKMDGFQTQIIDLSGRMIDLDDKVTAMWDDIQDRMPLPY